MNVVRRLKSEWSRDDEVVNIIVITECRNSDSEMEFLTDSSECVF